MPSLDNDGETSIAVRAPLRCVVEAEGFCVEFEVDCPVEFAPLGTEQRPIPLTASIQ
jgi:hypothetical protein